jgi:glycosyltransferase involved in cell wall biosynthesis
MLHIITEYFHPFSDAGGPIRSIENILQYFTAGSNICILTSCSDYNNKPLPSGYLVNKIVKDRVTGHKIAYVSKCLTGLFFLFRSVKPNDIVYINGLFKPSLNLIPILISNKLIICPRGMLQSNLLNQKSVVKHLYLSLLKFIFLFKNVQWHATTKQEALEITSVFCKQTNIKVISNIPVKPSAVSKKYIKQPQTLSLVYYGLIVENKGLLTFIQTLKTLNYPVSLDIYGSVKDQTYWKLCQQQINDNNSLASFNYKGHANPADSQNILAGYDALVLLTKGENFGHSIYEALSVGTPVIISDKTPWVFEGSSKPAGWLVNYVKNEFDTQRLKQVLEALYNMDTNTYSLSSTNAHKYAVDFYNTHDFKTQYTALFNSFN